MTDVLGNVTDVQKTLTYRGGKLGRWFLQMGVVALVAGIVVAGLGISARATSDDGYAQTAHVIKAGKPVTVTSSNGALVR